MTLLESYQATIITARMMGASESVLIIFEGTSVPYTVLFERVEYRCRPHQPKAAKCERCRAYGHRAINCSEAPTFWRCPTCATPLQQQQAPHPCTPWCYHCGGEHPSFDPACQVQQQKDKASIKAAYDQRLHLRNTLPRVTPRPTSSHQRDYHRQRAAATRTAQPTPTDMNQHAPSPLQHYRQPQQTIQQQASTPESTSFLPRTAEWGRQSPPPGSPTHQTSQPTIQRPLLRPAVLPPRATTLMEPTPGTRIPTTNPTNEAPSSSLEPELTPASPSRIGPSSTPPGTPELPTTLRPASQPPVTPSTPISTSPQYHQHMNERFNLIQERLAPCEQQIAQLTDRMMSLENMMSNILSVVDPLVSRINELTNVVTSLEKTIVALTSPTPMEAVSQSLKRPRPPTPTEQSAPPSQPPPHTPAPTTTR